MSITGASCHNVQYIAHSIPPAKYGCPTFADGLIVETDEQKTLERML